MSGKNKKTTSSHSVPDMLKELWAIGFFANERSTEEIKHELGGKGSNPPADSLRMALSRASFLTKRGAKGDRRYIQKTAPSKVTLSKDRFSDELVRMLNKDFSQELQDLRLNYGKSGICTAFLLRKILEKLIFIAFAKKGLSAKLKDGNDEYIGLSGMIKMATNNMVDGMPFLMPKTAKEIEGIKFLGDASAHNPLAYVDMSTIEPVMPFIVTAYSELAKKL